MAKIMSEKPNKKILGGKEKVRVAAIQAPQIVFNKEKSIDIAIAKIKDCLLYTSASDDANFRI